MNRVLRPHMHGRDAPFAMIVFATLTSSPGIPQFFRLLSIDKTVSIQISGSATGGKAFGFQGEPNAIPG